MYTNKIVRRSCFRISEHGFPFVTASFKYKVIKHASCCPIFIVKAVWSTKIEFRFSGALVIPCSCILVDRTCLFIVFRRVKDCVLIIELKLTSCFAAFWKRELEQRVAIFTKVRPRGRPLIPERELYGIVECRSVLKFSIL